MEYNSIEFAKITYDLPEKKIDEIINFVSPYVSLEFRNAKKMKKMLEENGKKMEEKSVTLTDGSKHSLWMYNIWDIIIEFIRESEEELQYNFIKKMANGVRVYDEVWTGNWWEKNEEIIQNTIQSDGKLLGIILYSDKTNLTLKGSQHCHPVNLSLGNLKQTTRSKANGRKLLCYMPVLDKETKKTPAMERELFHKSFELLLEPLIKKKYVILKDMNDRFHSFVPRIAFYISDWMESLLITCVRGCSSAKPCKFCFEKKENLSNLNPSRNVRERTVTNYIKIMENYKELVSQKKAQEAENLLKLNSMHNQENTFINLYSTLGFDCFQQTPPDRLHQADRGVFEWIFKFFIKYILKYGGTSMLHSVDQRIQNVPYYKGLHRLPSLFCIGKLQACEYRSLGKIFYPCICELKINPHVKKTIILYNKWYWIISKNEINDMELIELREITKRFGNEIQVFKEFSDSKLNFPKLHCMKHYEVPIKNFGRTSNFCSEADEKSHQINSKNPFKRTNGKNTQEQIARHLQRRKFLESQLTETGDELLNEEINQEMNAKLRGKLKKKTDVNTIFGNSLQLISKFEKKFQVKITEGKCQSYSSVYLGDQIVYSVKEHHQKNKKSFIKVNSGTEDNWFGLVEKIFGLDGRGFCIISWMNFCKKEPLSDMKIYKKSYQDVIEIDSIERVVLFIPSQSQDLYFLVPNV